MFLLSYLFLLMLRRRWNQKKKDAASLPHETDYRDIKTRNDKRPLARTFVHILLGEQLFFLLRNTQTASLRERGKNTKKNWIANPKKKQELRFAVGESYK
jgi:hypothetical protein